MHFLKRFGCFSYNARIEPLPAKQANAGVIFTNGTHILAGYQPNKKKPFISGIGGRINHNETIKQAAIREMLEELFDIYKPPQQLVESIIKNIKERRSIINGTYSIIVYSFEDLDKIIKIAAGYIKNSPIYKKFPENLNDLLWNREPKKRSEISHLCILPLVDHNNKTPFVDSNLLEDLKHLRQTN
jgi:hypothetical protein